MTSKESKTKNLLKEENDISNESSSLSNIKKITTNLIKIFGEGVVTTLGGWKNKKKRFLSTGSLLLDKAVGGGYELGKIVEIYGHESSGKTTLALHAVRECQKMGKTAVYIDVENSINAEYAKKIGVLNEELIIVYPKNGEEALDMVIKLIEEENIGLIVIDSVANLIPKAELEATLDKQVIGLRARLMSAASGKIAQILTGKETVVIFINQIRNKINTSFFAGNPETTPGGVSLKFFASMRIKLKKVDKIEKEGDCLGIKIKARTEKNRIFSPFKEAVLDLIFSQGLRKEREIIDLASGANILQKNGNWYSYKDIQLGNGKENSSEYLINNPDIFLKILREFENYDKKI